MTSNLDKKYVTGDTLSSILSQTVTKLNDKINDIPKVTIGDNGNFIIKGKDTGVAAKGIQGKTLSKIDVDSNNNVIITTNDGATSSIGNLTTTVSGGITSEQGLGEVRYYNGKFQYKYNNNWVDMVVTDDNKIIELLTPRPMQSFKVVYNYNIKKVSLLLSPPLDSELNRNIICHIDKVIVRKKKDSPPINVNDGEEVLTITSEHFKDYKTTPYIDNSEIKENETWYYGAFPISDLGVPNLTTIKKVKPVAVYGFRINQNESDPSSMITYIEDNTNFASAYMDYSSAKFNYGDWDNAWFIQMLKPCMLNYDGTVAYELDKKDYSKKTDGTPSDITNTSFNGNAMVGIPKVYYKIVDNGDDTADVYFSNKKVDNDYHCWSHLDNEGNEIDYCYMPIYNGSLDSNNRLRSLSGEVAMVSKTATQEITYAQANNVNGNNIWYTELWCDRTLINLLLMLIGKSTNTQTIFGNGRYNSTSYIKSGTLDTKGLFYGLNDSTTGVKVFGMENWWGNYRRRIAGVLNDSSNNYVVKMTYGQSDGSTVDGYNTSGSGYVTVPTSGSLTNAYTSNMSYSEYGMLPMATNGSATTYYCDLGSNYSTSGCYLITNGCGSESPVLRTGAFYFNLTNAPSYSATNTNASVSCKPSLATQISQS